MIKKLGFIFFALGFASAVWAAPTGQRTYEASGEVVNVSPVQSRITIKHGVIPGFSGSGETEFNVSSKELLRHISGQDLVNFTIVDDGGNASVTRIERTGVAVKEDKPLGQAIQETLEGAGQAVTNVAGVVPPAGEVVGAATGATTQATGSVLNNADPEVKQTF